MSLEFRFAKSGEYPLIARFLDEHWARQHIYVRSEALFRWTFERKMPWLGEESSVAVALSQGELVGILGGIPFTFNHFGERLPGVWLANYVIREDQRRGPAALKLLSMLRGAPFAATLAFGINPATASIYQVLKGKVFPFIPRHVAVLPEAVGRMAKILRVAHPDWSDAQAQALAEKYAFSAKLPDPAPSGEQIPPDWDEANWVELASSMIGAARDRDYLEWRYVKHPQFTYRFITVAEGARTGLAVWRSETIHRATPEGAREPVDRFARLAEFLPVSEENAAQLVAGLIQAMRQQDCVAVDYYGFHGKTRALLHRLGVRRTDELDGECIPSRFQPLDGKGGNILSAGFLPAGVSPCTLEEDCPWYWTKSDSDQDRPN